MLFQGYAHDVSISYVRGAKPINFRKVREAIARKLELIARESGLDVRPASVFLDDTDLPSNGSLTTECRKAAAQSAFLLSFVSIGYAGSRYCAEELDAFLSAPASRHRAADERPWQLMLSADAKLPPRWETDLGDLNSIKLYDANGPIRDILDDDGRAIRNNRFDEIIERICTTLWQRARSARLLPLDEIPSSPPPSATAMRVCVGMVDPAQPELEATRADLIAALGAHRGLEVLTIEDRQFEDVEDESQFERQLREQVADAALFVLVCSGKEARPPHPLLAQRRALPKSVPCLMVNVGEGNPVLKAREDIDPEPLTTKDLAGAAAGIAQRLGLRTSENCARFPWILTAMNDPETDRERLQAIQSRIDEIWRRKQRPRPTPQIYGQAFQTIRSKPADAEDCHGFLVLYVDVTARSMRRYVEDVLDIAERNHLDRETALAVFPPHEPPGWLRIEVINCNPVIDECGLERHLDAVWQRWSAKQEAVS